MEKVGFIGLGHMGQGICQNIINQGYQVKVFDTRLEAVKALEGSYDQASSARAVFMACDVTFLCLPSSVQVEEVTSVFLEESVTDKTVIDLSTSFPLSTRKIHDRFAAKHGFYADASLNGSPRDARQGTLIITFGGDQKIYDRWHSLISCFSREIHYMGGSGSGNLAKLACNYLAILYTTLYAELFPLLEKLEVDTEHFFQTIGQTGVDCGIYRYYAPKIVNKTYEHGFSLDLALKDATYVKRLYDEQAAPAFLLEGALNLLRTAIKDGKGKNDLSECAATMRQYLGLK